MFKKKSSFFTPSTYLLFVVSVAERDELLQFGAPPLDDDAFLRQHDEKPFALAEAVGGVGRTPCSCSCGCASSSRGPWSWSAGGAPPHLVVHEVHAGRDGSYPHELWPDLPEVVVDAELERSVCRRAQHEDAGAAVQQVLLLLVREGGGVERGARVEAG